MELNDPQVQIDELREFIGRTEQCTDTLTTRLCSALRATLGNAAVAPVPLAVHWCLGTPIVSTEALDSDGHPLRGTFLPPVPLPRRMWAAGSLSFVGRLIPGDTVDRTSTIANVTCKHGRTGPLCFVQVDDEIRTPRGVAIREQRHIVYRAAAGGAPEVPRETATALGSSSPAGIRCVHASPVMLFRYSALTFNSHRIHYDRPYASEVEGYPGLVVQAPLQATILLEFAADQRGGERPRLFSFKAERPLFAGKMQLRARADGDQLVVWSSGADGQTAMSATAEW